MVIQKRAELPAQLAAIPDERVVEVDVREELRVGHEPFGRIMAACGTVSDGGALAVRAIFEPAPLYRVLGQQGFVHYTEQLGDEDWRIWFYRPTEDVAASPASRDVREPRDGTEYSDAAERGGDVVILDVRDLEPPEPMSRTLEALESLPVGSILLHVNRRVPKFLLPHLESRGFSYEIREQASDLVRVFITRTAPGPDSRSA